MIRFLFFILFLLTFSSSQAQELDTIRLNSNLDATLEFDKEISFFILGNNPKIGGTPEAPINKYYDVFQQENLVIFKVKSQDAPFTTLNIKLVDGTLFHGFITLSHKPGKSYYNFKRDQSKYKKEAKDSAETMSADIENKLIKIKGMSCDKFDIAEIKKNIVFQVTNIVNDDKYYFIKVLLKNGSSNLYEIDGVTFRMQEGKKRSIKNKEISNQNWLTPAKTIYPENKQIKAYSSGYICFVIPLYNISTGSLLIKIVESKGARNGNIIVSADDLTNTKVF